MRRTLIILLLILPLIPSSLAVGPLGPSSEGSCAQTGATSAGNLGTRLWIIRTGTNTGLCSGTSSPLDFGSGSSLTLHCTEVLQGTVQPPEATTLRIDLVIDNTNFGSATPTAIRSITPASNLCAQSPTQTDTTIACTDTGSAGGSARYGIIRLHINAISTAVGNTYNVHSEDASANSLYGIYRCLPTLSALTESNSQTTYIGGDTIGVSYSMTAAPYDSTTSANGYMTCSPNTFTLTSTAPTTSTQTQTTTILGSAATWVTGCSIGFNLVWTRFSAVTGFTSEPWAVFTGSPPSGVTYSVDGLTASRTTIKPLDRTLTATGSCSVTVDGVTATVGNRQSVFIVSGCSPWKDARGSNVPNNQPARGWYQSSTSYRIATSFPSFDGLFGSQGSFPTTIASTTSAVVTTGLGYHKMVEEFTTTARSDAVLMNWGNSSGVLDVSSTYTFTAQNNSKTSSPTVGTNASSYIIGADSMYTRSIGLKGASGGFIQSGNVSCQETEPDMSTTHSIISIGATDASGNTPAVGTLIENPILGPVGTWTMICSVTMNGNTGAYKTGYFHTSAFTGNIVGSVIWNVIPSFPNTGIAFTNISVIIREFDAPTGRVLPIFPDDTPLITAACYNQSNARYDILIFDRNVSAQSDGSVTSAFYVNNLSTSENVLTQGCAAFATYNLTGSPFMVTQGYSLIQNLTGNFTGNFTAGGTGFACGAQPMACGFYGNGSGLTNLPTVNFSTNGNFSGNFTGNVSFFGLNGMISTAFDPYIALLLWGLLMGFFFYRQALVPAAGALICFTANLFTPSLIPLPACAMIFATFLLVHMLVFTDIFRPRRS